MLSTEPTGWPPIRTWLSGTSWLAFWKSEVVLVAAAAAEEDDARGRSRPTARAAIAAIAGGGDPPARRRAFLLAYGISSHGSSLAAPRPPTRGNGARIVSERSPAKSAPSGDLTGIQRALRLDQAMAALRR